MFQNRSHTLFLICSILTFAILSISCSSDNSPKLVEEVPEASCFDGMQNGNETGVDCGWSCSNSCEAVNGLAGDIVARVVLDNTVEYKLVGPVVIRDGGELEIRRGTTIRATSQDAYIAVAQGGRLLVYGKPDAPVVITSGFENPMPGDWGGIIVCGKAITNNGTNARSPLGDVFYGGEALEDSSGVIEYLRIEYTGATFEGALPFNGISLYGVGSLTNINNIQTRHGLGNGFAFYGGDARAKFLVSNNHAKNGVVFSQGWSGTVESIYAANNLNSGIQIANNETDEIVGPKTSGTISGVSIANAFENGILYNSGGGTGTLTDIFISEVPLGINVDGLGATEKIDNAEWQVNNLFFDRLPEGFVITNYSGSNQDFYSENTTSGAGNGAEFPAWAMNWAVQ